MSPVCHPECSVAELMDLSYALPQRVILSVAQRN